jgi:putative inorganic carbon (HCO3(-)) transporter
MAYYALIITWIMEYLRPGAGSPVSSSLKLYTVVPLATFLLAVWSNSRTTNGEIWSDWNSRWLMFFVVWILASMVVVVNFDFAVERLNEAFGYLLMTYVIARVADDEAKIRNLMWVLVAIHLAVIAENPKLITDANVRHYLSGVTFLGDGNDFALSVCFIFPMSLYLYKTTETRLWRCLYGFCILTLALAIIGTQSRGGSLALGATLGYLWWTSRSRATGAVALVVLIVAAFLFAGPAYFTRMETLSNVHADGSAQGRLDAWSQATYLGTRKNPLLGVGAGNFPLFNGGLTAHSMYYLALGELGIPGAIFAVGFIVKNFRRSARLAKKLKNHTESNDENFAGLFSCLAASTIGLGVAAAFLSALYYPHIFILGGLSIAAHSVFLRKSQAEGSGTTMAEAKKGEDSAVQRKAGGEEAGV